MRTRLLQQFFQLESASGIFLLVMTLIAMLWANSPLAHLHQQFIGTFLFWINEGLMTIFFLLVGLELKRGYLDGQLSTSKQIILPAVAALGGMIVPVIIYCLININNPIALKGWPTPVATDIAFALGVLSLFGRRVPLDLKIFLLALAIFDDIGAICIIAFCFSAHLSLLWLSASVLLYIVLYTLNRLQVASLALYLPIGFLLWLALLYSGIHPTLAGVLLALMIPNQSAHFLEKKLHPWVAYLIMPLFALANAGFSLQGLAWHNLLDGVVLGITLGLFLGKQIGVMSFSWLIIYLGKAKIPYKSTWLSFYGVALLCGIGFTMSLFLGTLSFGNENTYLIEVRLGVILGSILSGVVATIVLLSAFGKKEEQAF